jgi:hypothetical protein
MTIDIWVLGVILAFGLLVGFLAGFASVRRSRAGDRNE